MNNFVKPYCRLCFCTISNENFEKISDITMGSLDILLLNLDIDQQKHVICKVCTLKIKEVVKFKFTCICTENFIITHVSETGSPMDLMEIYAKEKRRFIVELQSFKVCRLCMELINGKFLSLHAAGIEAIEKHIPEINLDIIKDPVVCQQCFDSVGTLGSFLKNCSKVEQKNGSLYDGQNSLNHTEILPSVLWIKVEDSIVKQEHENKEECPKNKSTPITEIGDSIIKQENNEDETECLENKFNIEMLEDEVKSERISIKLEEGKESEAISRNSYALETQMDNCDLESISKLESEEELRKKLFYCDKCSFVGRSRSYLKRHQLKHKDPGEVQMYQCNECDLRSKYKSQIKAHKLIHMNPSIEEMFQCDQCSFVTKYKNSFKMHQLVHKDPSQVRMYKCDECSFESKFSKNLRSHQKIHKKQLQVQVHKCTKYSTSHEPLGENCQCNEYICAPNHEDRRHLVKCKDPTTAQMYKCDECSYETRYNASLLKHRLIHKSKMYKCERCSYKTKIEGNMKRHQAKHGDPSKEKMYQCEDCSYASMYKFNLKLHQLKHKDPIDVQMYKCDKCNYGTRYRRSLIRHQSVHKNVMYDCDNCKIETKIT